MREEHVTKCKDQLIQITALRCNSTVSGMRRPKRTKTAVMEMFFWVSARIHHSDRQDFWDHPVLCCRLFTEKNEKIIGGLQKFCTRRSKFRFVSLAALHTTQWEFLVITILPRLQVWGLFSGDIQLNKKCLKKWIGLSLKIRFFSLA